MKNRIILFSALSMAACKKADYLDVNAKDRPPLSSNIRFVNARTSEAGIHFWTFTQQLTTTPVLPGTASPYLTATYGNVQLNFTEGNGTAYIVSRQFGNSATYSATGGPNGPIAGYYHTVIAAPSRNDASKDSLILFYDDLTAPAAGKAKIRFIHLAQGIAAVKVTLLQNGKENQLSDSIPYGSANGSNILGKAYDSAPFVLIDAGKASVEVLNKATNGSLTLLQDLQFESGKIYTILLRGNGKVVSTSVI